MKNYNHKKIENKWQLEWEKKKIYQAKNSKKKKFYSLIEFPYPSGDGLHVGHIRSNTAMDIISRKRRMEGYNVLYPIGWDAFGLPTENYAIKTGYLTMLLSSIPSSVLSRRRAHHHLAGCAARRASAGLAVANSNEYNAAERPPELARRESFQ